MELFSARTDGPQISKIVDAGGVPVGPVDLHRVVAHQLGVRELDGSVAQTLEQITNVPY